MKKCKGKLYWPGPCSKPLPYSLFFRTLSFSPEGSALVPGNLEPRQTAFQQLQPLSWWRPGSLSRQVTPLDSHGAVWVSALLPPYLVLWFLASCWQHWTFGTGFGKIVVSSMTSHAAVALAFPCHLSHGMVESWPECGALLQYHLPILPWNVVYSMLCFSVFFSPCGRWSLMEWEGRCDPRQILFKCPARTCVMLGKFLCKPQFFIWDGGASSHLTN